MCSNCRACSRNLSETSTCRVGRAGGERQEAATHARIVALALAITTRGVGKTGRLAATRSDGVAAQTYLPVGAIGVRVRTQSRTTACVSTHDSIGGTIPIGRIETVFVGLTAHARSCRGAYVAARHQAHTGLCGRDVQAAVVTGSTPVFSPATTTGVGLKHVTWGEPAEPAEPLVPAEPLDPERCHSSHSTRSTLRPPTTRLHRRTHLPRSSCVPAPFDRTAATRERGEQPRPELPLAREETDLSFGESYVSRPPGSRRIPGRSVQPGVERGHQRVAIGAELRWPSLMVRQLRPQAPWISRSRLVQRGIARRCRTNRCTPQGQSGR